MKKVMSTLMLLAVLLGATACSANKGFTCVTNRNDTRMTVEGKVKNHKVTNLTIESIREYDSDDLVKLAVNEARSEASKNPHPGMKLVAEAKEKVVTIRMSMEISKLTKEAKQDAGIDLSNLDRDEFMKALEGEGYACE